MRRTTPRVSWHDRTAAYREGMHRVEPDDPLLPTVTQDETGGFDSLDEDLRENVPPHYA